MRTNLTYGLLFLLGLVTAAWAQTNITQWQPIGPMGGDINEIIETDSGDLIAGTRIGGMYRSEDKGASWSLIPESTGAPLLFVGVWDLIKNSDGDLFAATNRGVYRSTDDGASWALFDQGFVNRFVEALAVNAIDVLFAATRAGVFRSEDNGEAWVEFNNGLTDDFVTAIAINSQGDVFAGTRSGVFFSDDNGDNWTDRSNGFPSNPGIPKLFVTPDDSLYAGTFNGGYRSDDHGMNWQQVFSIGTTLSFGRNSSNLLVAGPAGSRIAVSADNGLTWTTAAGFQDLAGYKDLHFLSDTDLLAATSRYGMLHSTDNGDSWNEINSGIYATDVLALAQTQTGAILAGTGTVPFKSSDGGATWTFVGDAFFRGNTHSIAVGSTGRIIADIGRVLAISDDDGETWSEADTSFGSSRPESIAFGNDSDVYVGSEGVVVKSTDNGDTWTEFTSGLPSSDIEAMGVSEAGTVFAGTRDAGVYRSTSAGSTWVETNAGLPANFDVSGFLFQSSSDVLVSGFNGVYRSTDNGDSWTLTSSPPFFDIRAFAGSPDGNLYVGGRGSGVAVSEDNGESWQRINNGIFHLDVQALLVENTTTLYVGTRGGGTFKAEFIPTSVEQSNEELPRTFTLEQNYPNPFNPATTITFSLERREKVKLTIFDIAGREVATLVNGAKNAGQHRVVFDATGLASGIYFYRLQAGQLQQSRKLTLLR